MKYAAGMLTAADAAAVEWNDSEYLNGKGADRYFPETYAESVEYYRLAAAMGNVQSISNLGYCYLYGRGIAADLSLALAYFRIAAERGDVDAVYKLGDLYGSETWRIHDRELSVYYYRKALDLVLEEDGREIEQNELLLRYPSLCYALGREMSRDGAMPPDPETAYRFLKRAEIGYALALRSGSSMYQQSYEGVLSLLADRQFDEFRRQDRWDDPIRYIPVDN